MLALSKLIDRSDFDDPELSRYLHLAAGDARSAFGLPAAAIVEPDTGLWQCAMTMRAFDRHGLLGSGALVAGIGAGIESPLYALAAGGCVVVAADRYLDATPRAVLTPAGMMARPESFTSISYPRGNIIPVNADARALNLPSERFDAAYVANLLEHLGSGEAVAAAAEEIGRILKLGGVASVSTEFRLDGPADREDFDSRWMLFTRQRIDQLIVRPSGLRLVADDFSAPSNGTFAGKRILSDFRSPAGSLESLRASRDMPPNLVMFHDGFLFCSVHLTLRKDPDPPSRGGGGRSAAFLTEVDLAARLAAEGLGRLDALRRQPNRDRLFPGDSAAAERELAVLKSSRSWRYTRPFRELVAGLRRNPATRRAGALVLRALRQFRRLVVPEPRP
ncbi:MAG: methyltransferase domain-containing protein [Xanthobacteraceae bacterium]|nr:methyltransferase domain-containing protein [Xanthobacteraceae bacterium]